MLNFGNGLDFFGHCHRLSGTFPTRRPLLVLFTLVLMFSLSSGASIWPECVHKVTLTPSTVT